MLHRKLPGFRAGIYRAGSSAVFKTRSSPHQAAAKFLTAEHCLQHTACPKGVTEIWLETLHRNFRKPRKGKGLGLHLIIIDRCSPVKVCKGNVSGSNPRLEHSIPDCKIEGVTGTRGSRDVIGIIADCPAGEHKSSLGRMAGQQNCRSSLPEIQTAAGSIVRSAEV